MKKLKKVKLLGVAQNPRHSVFQLEKKKDTLNVLRIFLAELGFASWDTNKLLTPIGGGDIGKPTMNYANTLYDDKYYSLQKGQYTIDIFFGKKKVILSIFTLNDEQTILKEKLMKYCDLMQK